jgi:enoyl-CoA hydratase/carnithine racemase
MPEDAVLYEVRNRIAYITLNRPEAMNALNTAVRQGLAQSWQRFRDDPNAWVAIVTGAGERAFCAGADLKEMSATREAEAAGTQSMAQVPNGPGGETSTWKPIIAAINGYCLAGGLELALRCDLRIAAEHARFGLTEVTRGIIPGGGGTQRLPRAVPVALAMELIFTGKHITAEEAFRFGLLNRVVPAEQVMPAAEELARQIIANAPLAVRATKEAIMRGLDMSLDDGLRLEALISRTVRLTEDSREGPKAFAEKRPANFQGR